MVEKQNELNACGRRGGGGCAPVDVESMSDEQLEQTLAAVLFELRERWLYKHATMVH